MTPPLLALRAFRGQGQAEAWSGEFWGERLLLRGPSDALLRGLAGAPYEGEVELWGLPAADALERGVAALSPLHHPLPQRWTVQRYWEASWHLDDAGTAADLQAKLREWGVEGLASRRLSSIHEGERRATLLVAAALRAPLLLVVEDPSAGLHGEPAEALLRLLDVVSQGRHLLLFSEAHGEAMTALRERTATEAWLGLEPPSPQRAPRTCELLLPTPSASLLQAFDELGLTARLGTTGVVLFHPEPVRQVQLTLPEGVTSAQVAALFLRLGVTPLRWLGPASSEAPSPGASSPEALAESPSDAHSVGG